MVVVDDHEMVVAGIRAMLAPHHDRVQVVGSSTGRSTAEEFLSDSDATIELVAGLRPDVVLCDVSSHQICGLELTRRLHERLSACRVVLLTDHDEECHLFSAVQAGAAGYLLKRIGGAELADQLEAVRDGETVIDPSLAGRTLQHAATRLSDEVWPGMRQGLTHRESEVLSMTVTGLSAHGVAHRLSVDDETVDVHLRSIYRKLAVTDREGAVAAARDTGFDA
ncbi:response regulator [Pseudonocardia phyllosphaerae]|uniref:response regulator n=1 Tax=Pseudonocardia phyllosphaerae TaxID=3390502 RepID=UPI00397ACD58